MANQQLQRPAEMAKAYEAQQVEQRLYQWWESCGFFTPTIDPTRKPFVIALPPPNITGELHVGHAMYVIEDVMARWHRMLGDPTLWLPGTDHAGIATQLQVERMLRNEGTSREQIGRAEFERRTWEWKEKYGGEIQNQMRRLGFSCDWSRERFTMDAGLSRAVRTAFKQLYDDGLIYRGKRLINWSPGLQTAVSDLEVEHEERQVSMYYIRYPVLPEIMVEGLGLRAKGSDSADLQPSALNPQPSALSPQPWASGSWAAFATEYLTVATTRPETLMGDVALAVNPEDARYKHLIGRSVLLPVVGRVIPIVGDEYADPAFGTGVVKITPAHDPNDYQVALRQNLPMINIMNKDATLNAEAGPYAGQDRFVARKNVLADLEKEALLVDTKPHTMSVGISQRGGEVVEPLLSEQWFVRMQQPATMALEAVRSGQTKIIPERFEKVYFHWLDNIQDWCISRQLWWGHRIPVWYTAEGQLIVPGPDDPDPQGEGVYQDPDVLDTWFSSSLWPFSTLGWPDQTPDLDYFYPTSVLETGHDILFFWVARMMMMGCYLTEQPPFHTIYLHGLVHDEHGRKMSKTYGNVANPLDIMDQQGTDALRFTLATSSTPGQDVNLNPQRIEAARNFANKIWNITRFVISKGVRVQRLETQEPSELNSDPRTLTAGSLADRWILSRYNRLVGEVDRLMLASNFGEAGRQIYDFLWSEFADWYVELAKVQLDGAAEQQQATRAVLGSVLEGSLRLLHPFMPFVTEEAWQYLTTPQNPQTPEPTGPALQLPEHTIMLAAYPQTDARLISDEAERDWALVQELIVGVRNIRSEYKVEPARLIAATIAAGGRTGLLEGQRAQIARLARIADAQLMIVERIAQKPAGVATLVVRDIEVFVPMAGMVDLAAERIRLQKEFDSAEADLMRRESRLSNSSFVDKAPAAVVQREREGLETARASLAKLRDQLGELA
ncbi:MAG: valine--tRNA ligase [Roseiflexaceae bacterium]|nr:valine--tRNA ligase [Roseiflexaceae bacterium]